MYPSRLALLTALTAAALGCGGGPKNPVVPVAGTIAFADGSPLPAGTRVVFNPTDGGVGTASGTTAADGSFDLSSGLGLSYRDDIVSFDVAALDYAAPEHNRYMYKLEGFDRDWIDLGSRRHIAFTDLDHGSYVLRVKAASSDGVWNDAGIAVPLRVAPAPWETWWAYLGYIASAALVAAALYLGHRNKIRREEKYSQRLERDLARSHAR